MPRKRPLFISNWTLSSYNKCRRVRVSCPLPLSDTDSAEDSGNCPSTISYSDRDECDLITSSEVTSNHGIVDVECDDTSFSLFGQPGQHKRLLINLSHYDFTPVLSGVPPAKHSPWTAIILDVNKPPTWINSIQNQFICRWCYTLQTDQG